MNESTQLPRHRGFTIIQMVIAMVIFGILSGIGLNSYSKYIKSANIEHTGATLQIYATSMEDATRNTGFLTWRSGTDATTQIKNFLNELEEVYFTCSWDYASLKITSFGSSGEYGFNVQTGPEKDAWGSPFRLFYVLDSTGAPTRIMFASAGPDSTYADTSAQAYKDEKYKDDIVMLMIVR